VTASRDVAGPALWTNLAASPKARRMGQKLISIVIPVLNEAGTLDALIKRVTAVLGQLSERWEILFIDDGSTDETLARLRAIHDGDPRIAAISFSRNFGKELAIAAGLSYVRGDAAIIIDADLQHPPEVMLQFVEKWRQGYDIVYGDRVDRSTDGPFRKFYAKSFYRLFNFLSRSDIPSGAGDFRLLDRKAIDAMNRFKESSRFNKGLYSWIGFKSIGVPYQVADRVEGATKWSFRKLLRFAIDGLTSFSTLPLRVWSLLGLAISLLAIVYASVILVRTIVFGADVPGFPSIIISVMLLAGVQLISLGVLGEYLGRVYEEVKARPLFLIAEEVGVEKPKTPEATGTRP
jgi:glycosyltransferase involved in cell wall biosynthesis